MNNSEILISNQLNSLGISIEELNKLCEKRHKQKENKSKKRSINGNKLKSKKVPSRNSLNQLIIPQEKYALKEFFDDFNIKKYEVIKKRIGGGGNSSVYQLTISKKIDGVTYTTHMIEKKSYNDHADNLIYEAFIGLKYINELTYYFPCFLETYYALIPDGSENGNPYKLENNTKNIVKKACRYRSAISLVIQSIDESFNIGDYIAYIDRDPILKSDPDLIKLFPGILFQVYAVLSTLSDEYTHTDLHRDNVMLYQIPDGKYVIMHYHYPDGTIIQIKTNFIAIIIDYGNSYCIYSDEYFQFHKELQIAECKTDYTHHRKYDESQPYYKHDKTSDLRLAGSFTRNIHDYGLSQIANERIPIFMRKISQVQYKPKNTSKKISNAGNKLIYNVNDAHDVIKNYIQSEEEYVNAVESYYEMHPSEQRSDIHIYLDRSKPMEIIKM